MPNIVETVFTSKDMGVVDTIEKINSKLPEIARAAQASGGPVDVLEAKLRRLAAVADLYGKNISQAKFDELRSKGIPAVDELTQKILKAADAQRRLTQETKATTDQQRQLDDAVNRIRAKEARDRLIGATSSYAPERAPQFGNPETAARTALKRLATGYDEATVSAQKFHGVTLIGSQILRQFGVEGARGIEVVGRQLILLAEEGKSVKEIFEVLNSSKLLGFTALAAGALGTIQVVKSIVNDIRETAEFTLRITEQANRVNFIGRQGGQSQVDSDLKKLEQAKKDFLFFIGQNNLQRAEEILRTQVGAGGGEEEIQRARAKADALYNRRGNFGGSLAATVLTGGLALFSESTRRGISGEGASNEEIRQAYAEVAKLQGDFHSPELLDQKLKEVAKTYSDFQLSLYKSGDRTNIFDTTRESLRTLAAETGHTKDLDDFIAKLVQAGQEGKLGFDSVTQAVRVFKDGLESAHEAQQRVTKLNETLNKEFARENQRLDKEEQQRHYKEQGQIAVDTLRVALSDNPFDKFYNQAKVASEQFHEQNRKAAAEDLRDGLALIEQQKQLNIFREKLSSYGRLSDTLADRDRLGIVGGSSRRDEIGREQSDYLNRRFDNELETRRLLGQGIDETEALWRRVQTIQTNLSGRYQAEAIEQATRGLSVSQLNAAGVLNARIGALQQVGQFQDEDYYRQQRIRQIEDESRQRQVEIATAAFNSASSPEQRRLAVDAVLSALRDSGNLTTDQVDVKARFLDQSIAIQTEVLKRQQEREDARAKTDKELSEGILSLNQLLRKDGLIRVIVENADSRIDRLPDNS
jgi:hypothetical protein